MCILHPGEQLDDYRLESVVAHSGMATIFRARDLRTGQQVAIKVPHLEVESDPVFFERFRREEEIGQTLDYPGVVKVYRNENRSSVYLVMEWVEGKLLRDVLNEKSRLDTDRALHLALRLCEALEYIHSHGVVHRDLKPENIMVDADDNIKLLDFGIAAKAGGRRLTFGKLSPTMGTPDYISPEQVRGKRGDCRSDVYALGVMLYEMLTGQVPFPGDNPLIVMNARLTNDPESPRGINPELSPSLESILYRALARDPKERYASARDLALELEHPEQATGVASAPTSSHKSWLPGWTRVTSHYLGFAMIPPALAILAYVARRP